jgi:hypothetical protein
MSAALQDQGRAQTLVKSGGAGFSYNLSNLRIPTWTGGVMVVIDKNDSASPVIHSFGRDGAELSPITFTIAGAVSMRIEGVAHAPNGTYAICGRAFDAQGKGGGFVSWTLNGNTQKIVQLFPYNPQAIAMTGDGSTWIQGFEAANGSETDPAVNPSHGLIRRFDTNGVPSGSYVPRSSVFGIRLGLQDGVFAAGQDRVGWYANHAHVYIEVLADGTSHSYHGVSGPNSRWHITGLALSDAGQAVVSAEERKTGGPATGLYMLDKSSGSWAGISLPSEISSVVKHPLVLGSEPNGMVLLGPNTGNFTFLDVIK